MITEDDEMKEPASISSPGTELMTARRVSRRVVLEGIVVDGLEEDVVVDIASGMVVEEGEGERDWYSVALNGIRFCTVGFEMREIVWKSKSHLEVEYKMIE